MSLKLRNRISSKILDIIKSSSTPKISTLLELNKNKHEFEFHLPVSAVKDNFDSERFELFQKYQDEDIKKVRFDTSSKHAKLVFQLNKPEVVRETFKTPVEVAFNPKSINIAVEFSSPNIAKPFHVGHLRSTIIGNFISNLFRETNNKVTRVNWLGDWGTQFGFIKVGVDLENFTDEDLQKDPIKCLFKAYVTANLLAEKDPTISQRAREVFQQLESDNFQDIKKWEMYREYTVNELKQIYKRLNVEFDQYDWESMYGKRQIEEIIKLMIDKNILIQQDDGKQVVEIGERRIPIIKSDGTTLYLTRDLAAIIDRKKRFEFDEMFYVVDNGQNDHFQALTGLLQKLDIQWSSHIHHIKFGRIKGMSTRKGTVVFLQDILDEAKEIMWKRQKESSNPTNPPYPPYPNAPYPGQAQYNDGGYPPNQGFPYQSPTVGFVNPPPAYPQPGYPQPGGYPNPGYPQPGGYAQPNPNPPYMDPEDGGYKGMGFDDKSIRQGFIRKVYSILSIQLFVTLGFICMFTFNEKAKAWTQNNVGLVIGCMIASIVLMLVIVCCEDARRKTPMNFILLGLFTLCEGVTLGVVTTAYRVNEVMLAVGLTAVIVLALTIFAFQTKVDFTMMGGALCIGVMILFGLSIVGIFFRNNFFQFLIACGGALVFSLYIIYDTQIMMGGEHKYSISPEEYVFATKINLTLNDESVADILGISAVVINDLKQRRHRDYDFSWDKALQVNGDTGIKLQYTHCRLCSLEENLLSTVLPDECNPEMLNEPEAQNLIFEICKYPEVIVKSQQSLEACILVNYLFGLCNTTSKALKILNVKNAGSDELKSQRLLLFTTAKKVLHHGMSILGLKPLREM